MTCKPDISFFFPVYRDENTVALMTERAIAVLDRVANRYEIVIVDDGSPDRSGEIAAQLAERYSAVRVERHDVNRGYGWAVRTGFATATRYEWVCFSDGDYQYDPAELLNFVPHFGKYDLLLGFRRRRVYNVLRVLMSAALNRSVRRMFGFAFRDIACGFKVVHRSVLNDVSLCSTSGFIGAELAVRASVRGFRVGQIGISTYPREHGDSAAVSWKNIAATIRDLWSVRRDLFRNYPRCPLT